MSDRELDALVAERVMGWKHGKDDTYCERPFVSCPVCLARFSTNIAEAMQVVEKMRIEKWDIQITSDDESPTWQVSFDARGAAGKLLLGEGESDSLPEAICRAALAADEQPVTNTAVSAGTSPTTR